MRAADPGLVIFQAQNGRFIGKILGTDERNASIEIVARIGDASMLWDERWGGELAKKHRNTPLRRRIAHPKADPEETGEPND